MVQSIAGLFTRRSDAEMALQDLLKQGIRADTITLIAIAEYSPASPTEHLERDEATTAVVGSRLAGLIEATTLVLSNIGFLIAGPLATTLGAAGSKAEEKEGDKTTQLEQLLMRGGLIEEQASAYAYGIRQGRSLVAVAADDHQRELIADILRWHKGSRLDIHHRNE